MAFRIQPQQQENQHTFLLADDAGNGLEIWPAQGFNAYRWFVEHGGRQELFYFNPNLFQEQRPTRNGNPILFPFPNRIRDGKFSWDGKSYELAINDPAKKNAIHGFACRYPWRVTDQGADASQAWLTAEFQASKDAPDDISRWPADYALRFTYRFFGARVRLDIDVHNPDSKPLPFGLGFHPYFSLSAFGKEEAVVGVPARRYWPLEGNLPAGEPQPVDDSRYLRPGKMVGALHLDDVLTDLDQDMVNKEGLFRFGWLDDWQQRRRLSLYASPCFREAVVFNPPHREAFCIEPYTCTTDAVNLSQQGLDAGWLTLSPGEHWTAALDFVFEGIG